MHRRISVCGAAMVMPLVTLHPTAGLEPIPDQLVVLTFDDSKASHYTVVRPTHGM